MHARFTAAAARGVGVESSGDTLPTSTPASASLQQAPSNSTSSSSPMLGGSSNSSAGRPSRLGGKRPQQQGAALGSGRRSVVVICTVTLACVLMTTQMLRSVLLTHKAAQTDTRTDVHDHMTRRTLSFDTCMGTANHRLSILYGVLYAVELGRTPVLPKCIVPAEGAGAPASATQATPQAVPYSSLYDTAAFVASMAGVGVDVFTEEDVEGIAKTEVSLADLEDSFLDLHTKYGSISNLHISCPLFKLKRDAFRDSTLPIAWRALSSVKPAKARAYIIDTLAAKIRGAGHAKAFNMLHLRMESDWVQTCKHARSKATSALDSRASPDVDNCMAHTDDVDKILLAYNVPTSVPLLVSTVWEMTDAERAEAVLARLRKAGYTVFTSHDFPTFYSDDREANALLDYELALRAERFVGNSVSAFSALAILQRRQEGRWAAYYNLGAMPIEAHLPTPLLPWVFVYTSSTPEDDYMVKVAVQSAATYRSLKPICLWGGDPTAPIFTWLQENGVTMLMHRISWGDELWVLAEPHAAQNARKSPLYRSQLELMADFARVDVAILPELEQYAYVLMTSPYVVFVKEVSLFQLSSVLPLVIGMRSVKSDDADVPISDVLLLNLLELRSSYEEFKQFVLNSRHGANFPAYGPGASGAFAQFYEPYLRTYDTAANRLGINTGSNYDSKTHVVNFEGPKIHDFLHFYRTRSCAWGNACELGLRKSLCPTIKHWQSFINQTEDQLGVAMWYACETLYAPHLFWPKFQPTN